MGKYSDWYEVELEGYLRGRLPEVQRFEAIKELSNHFSEHVDDLVEKGMDSIAAEKAAIKSFGSPRSAAMNLLIHSRPSRVGGFLGSVGVAAMLIVIALLTFTMYAATARFQIVGLEYYVIGAVGIAALCSVLMGLGSILTKRVEAKKLGKIWAIGIAVTALVCLVAGKPQFAGIPDREMPKMVKQWKVKNALAFKLWDVDQKLRQRICTSRTGDDGEDLSSYKLAMSADGPKLLEGVSAGYVEVVGSQTSGYLVPAENIGHRYIGNRYGFEFNGTPSSFPNTVYKLRYEKDPTAAVAAWRKDGYPSNSSREPVLAAMAIDQFNFIAGAEQLPAMGLPELIFKSVGMVALFTGGWLAFTLLCSWFLVQLSSITFQSSFRRRIA